MATLIPEHLLFTEEHEYVQKPDAHDIVSVGITDYASHELGDVVYVDLPQVGAKFKKMEVLGTIEAVKAVSDLYAPVSGTVLEVNSALASQAEIVNKDPYGKGWMVKMRLTNPAEVAGLLNAESYAALTVK